MPSPTSRRTLRVMALIVGGLVVAGLMGTIVRQSWLFTGAANEVVRMESLGAQMMHPMTTLLGRLVEAQSAAVRGEPVDADGLRKSLASLTELDEELGNALQTHQRLTDLNAQIESALGRNETGRPAFVTYSTLTRLAQDLVRRIGDTSHLIHDPELDSYYLMEAAIIHLPDAVVLAGRASDLVTLSGGKALQGEDAAKAAVARFGVSSAAESVNSGLTKSIDVTARAELGSNIAERLDTFKAATDAFAPPTMLAELASMVDAPALSANARRVYAAATPLSHLLIGELEALLSKRMNTYGSTQRFTVLAAGAIAVLGVGIVVLLIVGRQRRALVAAPSESAGAHARLDNLPLGSLTYARELLDAEELVHAGRAGRARTGRGSDAR